MNTETTNEVGQAIIDTSKDLLDCQKSMGVKTGFFGTHYVDVVNDINGIGELINAILANAKAYSPETGLFACEIDAKVRRAFAEADKRYPATTLRVYLSNHKKGYVYGIHQCSKAEEKTLCEGKGLTPSVYKTRKVYFLNPSVNLNA